MKLPKDQPIDNHYEKKEISKGRIIETANGSIYRYLEDGRTQRFKTVEGKNYEPQDLLVFVPSYEWVLKNNAQWLKERNLESRNYYEQHILEHVQAGANNSTKKIWVVDLDGNKIETNEAAKNAGKIFLAFGEQGNLITDMIPVSKEPIKGFYTYDSRVYENEQGEKMRERHLGNQVIDIKEI
jgi:hypothetical protein